ncbi:hypothetical protein [Lactobacillus sp. ESL0681]|uniref:hypothetical protein n=1 Tax=Lactobacillus sp. ESL0681 TaxID=2983211 RepID=UPI0032AF02AC
MINKVFDRIKRISLIQKLNQYSWMPVIWWSILVSILPLVFSLIQIPIVWRVGLLFMLANPLVSYHLGRLIEHRRLNHYWLLFLPGIFCIIILLKYAKYNLLFGLIYLIFEIFGLMDKHVYNQKG